MRRSDDIFMTTRILTDSNQHKKKDAEASLNLNRCTS